MPIPANGNIVWHSHRITQTDRANAKCQRPAILWLTGMSGAGKSTLANALESHLHKLGHHTYILDGDNVRHGLNKDLGFSDKDRVENIRRIGEVAMLFLDSGLIVMTAFISPFRADRDLVRELVGDGEFIEVFVHAPLKILEARDPKGLYKKARSGEISNFTGIDSPYENPESPEVLIDTSKLSIEESVKTLMDYLESVGALTKT